MNSYYLYIIIASTTIASPGPGVVMTLTNSLKYGLKSSIFGILGVTLGMFIIAIVVGGGVGVIISQSMAAYYVLKIIGAIYLLYLGVKLILNRNKEINIDNIEITLNKKKSLFQGLAITLINPKPILFFIALFPQFINSDSDYYSQFAILSITFCFLIILIHLLYGFFAGLFKHKSQGKNYFKHINTIGGTAYIIFAISLFF